MTIYHQYIVNVKRYSYTLYQNYKSASLYKYICMTCCVTYHLGQQGAAGVQHERVDGEDLSAVHLDLHVAELRVVHHAAQVT